jgi:hypothetical protein
MKRCSYQIRISRYYNCQLFCALFSQSSLNKVTKCIHFYSMRSLNDKHQLEIVRREHYKMWISKLCEIFLVSSVLVLSQPYINVILMILKTKLSIVPQLELRITWIPKHALIHQIHCY